MMARRGDGLLKTLLHTLAVLTSVVFGAAAVKYRRPSFCEGQKPSDGEPMSFLWTLKREPPVYFFGTIHVPYTRVWDHIPDNVKHAFEQADNVFFELDLMDPYTIAALANCQMLPSGKSLSDILPKDIYRRLKLHLNYVKLMMPSWMTADQKGKGLYAEYLFNAITGNWEKKRPVWVMLMVNSLTESDIKSRGIPVLDLYLAQEAQRMKKRSGAVERVEEQCVPLNGLNFTQVLFALNQTLFQQESLRSGDLLSAYTTDDLIKHYNCGNLDSIIFSQDTSQVPYLSVNSSLPAEDRLLALDIDRYFRKELIDKRNSRMAERVVELMRTYPDESFFFAFGAGHFLGNNTVLDSLESKGFKIEQIPVHRKIRSFKRHHSMHHRHKGTLPSVHHLPFSNDLVHGRSWEEERNGRGSRRRYRKRHPHHHHGVVLLRTSTTPPVKTQQQERQRTFNDLWIKLDTQSRPTTRHLPQSEPTSEAQDFRKNLQTWYGLPSAAPPSTLISWLSMNWCLYIYTMSWTFNHIRIH